MHGAPLGAIEVLDVANDRIRAFSIALAGRAPCGINPAALKTRSTITPAATIPHKE